MVDDAGGVANLLENERSSGNRRMAFLDLMLDMHSRGELSLDGIQEEVDTFTFEVSIGEICFDLTNYFYNRDTIRHRRASIGFYI